MQYESIIKKQNNKCINKPKSKTDSKFKCPRWQLSGGNFNESGYFVDNKLAYCPECYIVKTKKEITIIEGVSNGIPPSVDEDSYNPNQTKIERKKINKILSYYTKKYIITNYGSKIDMKKIHGLFENWLFENFETNFNLSLQNIVSYFAESSFNVTTCYLYNCKLLNP